MSENKITTQEEDRLSQEGLSLTSKFKVNHQRCLDNMEGMSKKEKVKYFLYFYRGYIVAGIILLFLIIAIPIHIYNRTRPVAISYAVLNQASFYTTSKDSINEYMDYFDYGSSYKAEEYSGIQLLPQEDEPTTETVDNIAIAYQNETSAGYIQFPLLCRDGYIDFVLMDSQALECLNGSDLFTSLESTLSSDIYRQLLAKYPELKIISIQDADGNTVECAIDVSDTDFVKGFDISYSEVYLAFPKTKDPENIKPKQIIEFIYGIKSTN